jgi:sec-independent protein translocase protein TatB
VDLSIGKLLVIGVVALFFVSPDKLPQYAAQLARWVRVVRSFTDEAKHRVATEMGPEFEDVDWAKLDPRRYHPRRLLTDAWNAAPADGPAARPIDHGDARSIEEDGEPDLLALADRRAETRTPAPAPAHFEIGS